MTDYRCYLLDGLGAIRSVEEIGAKSDDDAILLARSAFARRPQFRGFELWQRSRRVHYEQQNASDIAPPPSPQEYRSAQQ